MATRRVNHRGDNHSDKPRSDDKRDNGNGSVAAPAAASESTAPEPEKEPDPAQPETKPDGE